MDLPDYWLSRPGGELGPDVRASFDRLWDAAIAASDPPLVEIEPALRWQFLYFGNSKARRLRARRLLNTS